MAKEVLWAGNYGPSRSHDTVESAIFQRKKDAVRFVQGKDYWRITRLEYADKFSAPKVTEMIGGVDVDRQIKMVRIGEQYRTGRPVSTKKATEIWLRRYRAQQKKR